MSNTDIVAEKIKEHFFNGTPPPFKNSGSSPAIYEQIIIAKHLGDDYLFINSKDPEFSKGGSINDFLIFSATISVFDTKLLPSKHETLNQCYFNVGPVSQTMGQH